MMVSLFSFENLHRAYLNCRRGKRNSRCALLFEQRLEENLFQLCKDLQDRTYQPAPSSTFITGKPKHREIFAADFRDRIVHHLVVAFLEPLWERVFIHDSYACRRNKGTHAAVFRLQDFMRRVTHNGAKRAHFLHMDIRSYFLTIDKEILYGIVCDRIGKADPWWAEEMKWLTRTIIFHDPTVNARKAGQLSLFDVIPRGKTLSSTSNRTGLPIGNYTSQFFANVYLDCLDQYAKHELKVRYYLRYVDDLVLLHEDPGPLEVWEEAIERFADSTLRLKLHRQRRRLEPVSNGCDFLGYIVKRTHLLPRRRTVQNCRERLRHFRKILVTTTAASEIYRYPEGEVSLLFATLMSYEGQFRHASSYRLWSKLFDEFAYLRFYVRRSGSKWTRKDRTPKRFVALAVQYRWFARRFRNCLMFFQVGCFFEFYRGQARKIVRWLGLKNGRGRRSLGTGVGLPVRCARLDEVADSADMPLVVILQNSRPAGGTLHRRLSVLYVKPRTAPSRPGSEVPQRYSWIHPSTSLKKNSKENNLMTK